MTADWRHDAVRDITARKALLASIPDPEDRAGVSALIDLVVSEGTTIGHAVKVIRNQVVTGLRSDDTLRRRLARIWAAVDATRGRTPATSLLAMRAAADHVAHVLRQVPSLTIRTDYGTYDLRPRHGGPGYEATRR